MTTQALKEILDNHKLWLRGDPRGTRAVLTGAVLTDADLTGAVLTDAVLTDGGSISPDPAARLPKPARGDYAARAARYRLRHPDVPVVAALDRRILALVEAGEGTLDMSNWHTCETTHCRAGWAITLAGEPGKKLEEKYGPFTAGVKIYQASTGKVPHFFASTKRALDDIRTCAARQSED